MSLNFTGLEKYLNSTLPVGQVTLKFCLSGALPLLPKVSNSLIIHERACFNHLTQMVFNSLNVHLHLVYNVAPRNHIEEKCKKFKTSRINKSPSHFSFDTGTVLNLKRPQEHIFSCQCVKNSFSQGNRSSFEIKLF